MMRVVPTITLALAGLLGGCQGNQSGGTCHVLSLGPDPVILDARFTVGYFSIDAEAGTSYLFSDVPPEQLLRAEVKDGNLLHLELLWRPKPGATPMDPSATNFSVRYVAVTNGEVGVYSGAGFGVLGDSRDQKRHTIVLRDASLKLQDATSGFADLLTPAQLTGHFTAVRDDAAARRMHAAISQFVTNNLGRTRIVKAKQQDTSR